MPIPEIIAPAGDLHKLRVALAFGADAVYCGLPSFSLRARENEFTYEDLLQARQLTREAGVKMYLTCNIFPRNPQLPALEKFIREKLPEIQPDAVIFADPGVFALLRTHAPKLKLHLSVQANNVNAASAKFWYDSGVSRIIVARELSLREISEIHATVPELELEAFVHGSICFTYSGRCLISNYLAHRDGNRGTCANSCRWRWTEVQEEKRPDQKFELEEDEHGSYLFNSKDLCLIEKLGELAGAGVTGFKIEGRHKSEGYLGTITRAYRLARDAVISGQPFDPALLREVSAVGNRGYTLGFFDGSQKDLQNYERQESENTQSFFGLVERYDPVTARALVAVRNKFVVGESIEVVTPTEVFATSIGEILTEKGQSLEAAHGGQAESVWLDLGREVPPYSLLRRAR